MTRRAIQPNPADSQELTHQAADLIRPYLEGELQGPEAALVEDAARRDPAFHRELENRRWLIQKMNKVYSGRSIDPGFQEAADEKLRHTPRRRAGAVLTTPAGLRPSGRRAGQELEGAVEDDQEGEARSAASADGLLEGLQGRFGSAPWWLISTALHALAILLTGLVTMAVHEEELHGEVVVTTELAAHREIKEPEPPKERERSVLETSHDTPATDPDSKLQSDIVVPPDILAKAELGDHFETINPDRPDTHSAFGNPDAHMFHSEKGSDDEAGGGGNEGLALDEVIGIGGGGSPGTGGGWGGGHGTGVGVDKGSGRGSFGQRGGGGRRLMVMRHGGSKATESGVDHALEWLARHQEADGRWSVRNTEGTGTGGSVDWDPGVTGLALLAFLGAGHSEKIGRYKANVGKAIDWIISQQRADGAIGTDKKWTEHHGGYGYHHAICGMALAEAWGMGRVQRTRDAAQKAIQYSCEEYQYGDGSEKLAWRYQPKAKEADISVSGWYVMQLKSAKVAGLQVNPASFEGAIKLLDSRMANPASVKKEDSGYDDGRHRYGYLDTKPMFNTTSIGILCRLFTGTKPEEVHGAARWLLKTNPPAWQANLGEGNGGGWPMYYMYYTTLTMFQAGGDLWKEWNDGLKTVLVTNQRKGGDADGSWDPLSTWEKYTGRAYTTALGAMCLEVYYRYLPLYR